MNTNYILISAFITIMFLQISCSKESAKDYVAEAEKNYEKGDYVAALNYYKKIYNNFPEDTLAPKALFEIGKIYQSKLITGIEEKKSFENAVEFYGKIVSEYPKSKEAVYALFMIGFIEHNYLNNMEKAREAYSKFLENYPSHELSLSAKIELENLGKPPEEILKSAAKNQ